jgi:4-hydroxybenzoate polyprenyltransferase
MIVHLVRLIRPKQWIKNFFVFAPLLFSRHIFQLDYLIPSVAAFFVFSLASSAIYIINDIMDVESDRMHPKKKYRPIASGEVSTKQALIFFVILVAAIIVCLFFQRPVFAVVIILYFITNLLYSIKVKSIVLLDVFFISFGFMLRVLGGAAAIGVPVSTWMVLTTIFISLFLAISKRRGELSQIVNKENIDKQRKVLKEYSVEFADEINTIAAAGTIVSYALYTVSERTVNTFGTDKLIYTTPFVIYGIFRYMYLMHQKNMGESPTSIVTKDLPIILVVLAWFMSSLIIIYRQSIPYIQQIMDKLYP